MDVFKGVDIIVEKYMYVYFYVQYVYDEIIYEYYFLFLIGIVIGVVVIFCFLLVIFCICCRRRIKKKIYVERELEKLKLFEGIYIIGVFFLVYEVNGIFLFFYEEV